MRKLLLFVFATLLYVGCTELNEIKTINHDFNVDFRFDNISKITEGKPVKIGIQLTGHDKSNEKAVFITKVELIGGVKSSLNGSLSWNDKTGTTLHEIRHDFNKNDVLWFDFLPKEKAQFQITVTVDNGVITKTITRAIDCNNSFFIVGTDNVPETLIIDTEYNFDLIVTELENSKELKISAKHLLGSGNIFIGSTHLVDSGKYAITGGRNVIRYTPTKKGGNNVLELTVSNEYGYQTKLEITLPVILPQWRINKVELDTILIPFEEDASFKFDIVELDDFNNNKFSGVYRCLTNATMSFKANADDIVEGKTFSLLTGSNILNVFSQTIGVQKIELSIKDQYNQVKKDTLVFKTARFLKPIVAQVDKPSQKVKTGQHALVQLTLSEQNYSDIFQVKLEVLTGNGVFVNGDIQNLSAGTHAVTFIPKKEGTHTYKITVTDKNNQLTSLTVTVQAELVNLEASINVTSLSLLPDETGTFELTVFEPEYTGKYKLEITGSDGIFMVNGVKLANGSTYSFTSNDNTITYKPNILGEHTINLTVSDEYGQKQLLSIKVNSKGTITVKAQAGGTVNGGGIFEHGSNVTVVALPSAGYYFAGWYDGGIHVSTSMIYTFKMDASRTLEARFTANRFIISVKAQTGGTATGGGSFDHNTDVTVTAFPQTGYTFKGWYENGTLVSTNTTYTFKARADRSLEADFTANMFNIIVNTQEGGTVTGSGSYAFGANVSVTATPSNGYTFEGWYDGSSKVSTTTTYTFKASADRTLEARFIANKFNIIVNAKEGGTVTGSGSYAFGANVSVTATPSTGYTFEGWYEGTTKLVDYMVYTFNVEKNRTLEARFIKNKYTVSVKAQTGGTATGNGTFEYNTNVTVSAAPNTGYTFDGWYNGANRVSTSQIYNFFIDKDTYIEARFIKLKYNLNTTAQAGGTATGNGTFDYNTNVTVSATPNTGYTFDGWYDGANKISNQALYSFLLTKDTKLDARFVKTKYAIVVTTATGGTATGGGLIDYGTNTTVTAFPQTGYSFLGWYENSNLVNTGISYTFQVSAARTLEARFKKETYPFTAVKTLYPSTLKYNRVNTFSFNINNTSTDYAGGYKVDFSFSGGTGEIECMGTKKSFSSKLTVNTAFTNKGDVGFTVHPTSTIVSTLTVTITNVHNETKTLTFSISPVKQAKQTFYNEWFLFEFDPNDYGLVVRPNTPLYKDYNFHSTSNMRFTKVLGSFDFKSPSGTTSPTTFAINPLKGSLYNPSQSIAPSVFLVGSGTITIDIFYAIEAYHKDGWQHGGVDEWPGVTKRYTINLD